MFNCERCKKTARHPNRIVVEKRDKVYDGGHRGWEIAKEMNLCDECFKKAKE